jgi:rare lipoprotein A
MKMMSNFVAQAREKIARGYSGYHWKLPVAGLSSLLLAAGIVVLADKPVQAKLGSASSAHPAAPPSVATTPTPAELSSPSAVKSGNNSSQTGTKSGKNPTFAAATAALAAHKLEGIASWYGAVLNGHRTASGERFNMYEFTACHTTLPFGTIVKVTNKTTGRSVNVRINDRGILSDGRIIDLSFAAAAKIGIVKAGLAEVKLDIIQMGNGHHHWIHDEPGEKVLVQPPPAGYDGPMNIAQR